MNNIYVFCGVPGSGKTTISSKMADKIGAKFYSYDDIKLNYKRISEKEKHKNMFIDISADLTSGKSVVVDDLHLTKEDRNDLLIAIKDIPCNKILIVMTTPLEECILRNRQRANKLPDKVVYHANTLYQPPTLDEGWDEILYFK